MVHGVDIKNVPSVNSGEVVERVLDKGIIVDANAHFSVVGLELITVDAHFVIASIDTYLKHAAWLQFGLAIVETEPRRPA